MTNTVLASLVPTTYRQSDLAYRIGLLREFFEFVFFTQQKVVLGPEAVAGFASVGSHAQADLAFLRNLPQELFASIQSATFHDMLDQALKEAKSLPTVRLTLAVLLPTDEIAAIGKWVRGVAGPETMLEFSLDPEIGAGCQVLWQDVVHDYSLEQSLRTHEPELYARIPALFSAQSSA